MFPVFVPVLLGVTLGMGWLQKPVTKEVGASLQG